MEWYITSLKEDKNDLSIEPITQLSRIPNIITKIWNVKNETRPSSMLSKTLNSGTTNSNSFLSGW